MRAFILLLCLAVGCLAQRSKPCESPSLLSGSYQITSPRDDFMVYSRYTYDALRQRVYVTQIASVGNKTIESTEILLYREGVKYEFSYRHKKCIKKPLDREFQPWRVPKDAYYIGQAVLGASSGFGQGLLIDAWQGELSLGNLTAKYRNIVTVSNCIPVTSLFYTDFTGWLTMSFYDGVIGIVDPEKFIPPSFCEDAKLEMQEPVHFFHFFEKKV